MTSPIARLTLLVCLLCGALLGATMRIGGYVAPSHAWLLTRNPCALPCLFGVTPGISTRDQAMPLFERSAVSYSYYNPIGKTYPTHTSADPISLMLYMTFGDPFIGDVRGLQLYEMSGPQNLGYLGDFLLAGYQPDRVFAACQDNQHVIITLNGQHSFLQIPLDTQLTPNAPVVQVNTASDASAQARSIHDFVCAFDSPWTGFAASWKYQPES